MLFVVISVGMNRRHYFRRNLHIYGRSASLVPILVTATGVNTGKKDDSVRETPGIANRD